MAEKKAQPPSREGLVSFTFWTDPEIRDDIKRLAIDVGKSVQELMIEASADLLAKHRKKLKPRN